MLKMGLPPAVRRGGVVSMVQNRLHRTLHAWRFACTVSLCFTYQNHRHYHLPKSSTLLHDSHVLVDLRTLRGEGSAGQVGK